MSNLKAPPVHRVIVAQLVATVLMALTFLVFSNVIAAYSILIGGLVSAIPNAYFAVQAFRYRGARNAEKVVKSFRKGYFGKLGITIMLFAVTFTLVTTINEIALILGFVIVQFVGTMMSGLIDYSPQRH
ncbi:MAG: ATP synthase subunit I [Gammaproteobacteria bacterium]|nr:ATP synthase subunit I [Pseudomonadales bacterium]MCP5347749.1 ATP synthase subunit I [Pseudomonadales bacterium]